MKKIICIVITLLTVISLSSCGGTDTRGGTVVQTQGVDDVLSSAAATSASSSEPLTFNPETVKSAKVFSGKIPADEKYDVDLSALNATMVYTQVSDMVSNPDNYKGKYVKMDGRFAVYEGETRNYYACLISDATACCSQGIEFVPTGMFSYPDDYPPLGTDITVTGVFDTYFEGTQQYFQLKNAHVYYTGA